MEDPHAPRSAGLAARIDVGLRERLEEAIDFLCLDALVQRRRALGLPAPAPDSAGDREEFAGQVRAFLERLGALAAGLDGEQRRKVEAAERAAGDATARLLAVQTVLARELPDYWERFDAARAAYVAERVGSGGQRRGLLSRLFGRG
jgi:hypothetical protein